MSGPAIPVRVPRIVENLLGDERDVIKRELVGGTRGIFAGDSEFEGLGTSGQRNNAKIEFVPGVPDQRIFICRSPDICAIYRKLHDAAAGSVLRPDADIVGAGGGNVDGDCNAVANSGGLERGADAV